MLDWRVPGYRMLRALRAGTVLARHEASGHPVLLRYHAPTGEEGLTARRAEAEILAGLASPHVARLYEHIEVALPPQAPAAVGAVTVREYVAGASVGSLVAKSPLPPESALGLLRTGLLALRCAHEHGVTHRGYKPENLLVAVDGTARLADFALTALTPLPPPTPDLTGPSSAEQRGILAVHDDVRAAFAVFVTCLGGRAEKLPRRLRPLVADGEAGDGAALLDSVERIGRAAWGADWPRRGERELTGRVARTLRRTRAT